jgi:hypothetical protein
MNTSIARKEASVSVVEVATLITSSSPAKLNVERRGNAFRPRQNVVKNSELYIELAASALIEHD